MFGSLIRNRTVLTAAGLGVSSGLLFLLPFIGFLALIPLYLAALSAGWMNALLAGAAGGLVVALAAPPEISLVIYLAGFAFAPVLAAFMIWGDSAWLRPVDGVSVGRGLASIAGLGAALSLTIVLYVEAQSGVGATSVQIKQLVTQTFQALADSPQATPEQAAQFRAMMEQAKTNFQPGLVEGALAGGWMLLHVFSAWIAVLWSKRAGRPGGEMAFADLECPRWAFAGIGLAALATLIAADARIGPAVALTILVVPFMLEGLAVIHTVTRTWDFLGPLRPAFLAVVWLLTLITPPLNGVVTLIGMTDRWLGLRARARAKLGGDRAGRF
jgi:hypothetical protein